MDSSNLLFCNRAINVSWNYTSEVDMKGMMKDFEDQSGWSIRRVVKWIFISVLLVGILIAAVLGMKVALTPLDLISKTVNADQIIANYQWFYDQKSQIDATTAKWRIAEKAGMVEANGIQMVLMSMIGEYNSRSKQINRNMWKAQDLPYQMSMGVEK
jgi:hypothetical protein